MMGFPGADKQAVCPSLTPLHHFTRKHVFPFASHHFTDMTHASLFFSSLLFVFFVFFLIALCSLLMSIFIPAFTGGVREMTRLGRLAHLHGNYTASLRFLMQPLLLHHIPLWLSSYYHSYQACFFRFSPLEDFLPYTIPHLNSPLPKIEPTLASLDC